MIILRFSFEARSRKPPFYFSCSSPGKVMSSFGRVILIISFFMISGKRKQAI